MLENCPVVDTFYQNGYVLHATSTSPFGPFSNGSEVLPNWSTQPEIHFDPSTHTYVLMHSRYDSMKKRSHGQIAAFPCGKDGRKAPPPEGFDPKPKGSLMERNVSLAYSKSLDGPWECCLDVSLDSYMANPTILIHRNGSVVLTWRGSKGLSTGFAPSIHGPFRLAGASPGHVRVDPHLIFLDEPPSYHVISLEGGHDFSIDAVSWQAAAGGGNGFGPAYNGSVAFSPTSAHSFGTRECPKIVQKGGVGGAPMLLSSVVQKLNSNDCGSCRSATVVQQIGGQRPAALKTEDNDGSAQGQVTKGATSG